MKWILFVASESLRHRPPSTTRRSSPTPNFVQAFTKFVPDICEFQPRHRYWADMARRIVVIDDDPRSA